VRTFDDATVNAILKSRFRPAMRNGLPTEFRTSIRITYSMQDGGMLWKLGAIKKMREAAEQGNPYAKYVIGLLGTLDPTLNVPEDKARQMIISAAQFGSAPAQYWVAQQLNLEQMCGSGEKMSRWLGQAAKGGDAGAQIDWVELKLASPADASEVAELKAMLTAAVANDNAYALKHAAAIFAVPANDQVGAQLVDKELALSTALRLKKYDTSVDPQVNDVMAAAFAVNDNFRDAVKQQERAVSKAQKLHWNTQNMEARLAAYNTGKLVTGDLFALPPVTVPLPPVDNELAPCTKKGGCGRQPDDNRAPTGSFIR
jgi:hypothetical protein